jgi:hypothetical protein
VNEAVAAFPEPRLDTRGDSRARRPSALRVLVA